MGQARGEVELESKVLVLKRVRVTYRGLTVVEEDRSKVERVLAVHAEGCPVARSLRGAVEIATELG